MTQQAPFFTCDHDPNAIERTQPQQPYYTAAGKYFDANMAVIPCMGESGKIACVKWGAFKQALPSGKQIKRWQEQFPQANIGLITGAVSGLTVVDIDTGHPETIQEIIDHYGDTPMKVKTPSGGLHLYYSYNNEGSHTRVNNRPVDIRADGGYVIAPPSTHPDTGQSYRFAEGGLNKLYKVPRINSGALPKSDYDKKNPDILSGDVVPEGQRNSSLFQALIKRAKECSCYDEMDDTACFLNQLFMDPPLPEDEVEQVVYNAWRLKVSNQIYGGDERFITVISDEVHHLQDQPRAFWLLMYLNDAHSGRREKFAISPKAIAENIGWDTDAIRHARQVLIDRYYIECVHTGGNYPGDASLFKFHRGRSNRPN